MPKDNISRAISKSEMSGDKITKAWDKKVWTRIALIIEILTDNKNRSASSIRTVLQKVEDLGNRLHITYVFQSDNHINKDKIKEDELFEKRLTRVQKIVFLDVYLR